MNQVEIITIELLQDMEIPPNVKGYEYLKTAIPMIVNNHNIIHSVTKELYPSIALKHDTKWSRVERAIRHSIDLANKDSVKKILKLNENMLSGSCFMAALSETVKIRIATAK